MEPHEVPIAPHIKRDMRRILLANLFSAEMGALRKAL